MTEKEAFESVIQAARNYAEFISGNEDEFSQGESKEILSLASFIKLRRLYAGQLE